jgi:hypothetical protein
MIIYRICPGRYMAERIALLFVASILSAYNIVPIDAQANKSPLPFTEGMIVLVVSSVYRLSIYLLTSFL